MWFVFALIYHRTTFVVFVSQIETERLRPLQRNTYLKMAECCNSKSSSQDVERCVRGCASPGQIVQQVIQNEIGQLQNRLERCSMQCQDEVQDKYPNLTSLSGNPGAEAMMTKCASSCVDKHIAMLKSIKYNIDSKIDEVTKR